MEQTKQELSLIIKKITESFPDENDLKGFLGISKTLIINSLTESGALLSNLNEHDNHLETILLKRELADLYNIINQEIKYKFDLINQRDFNSVLKSIAKIKFLIRETYFEIINEPIKTEANIVKAKEELVLLESKIEELKKAADELITVKTTTVQSISNINDEVSLLKKSAELVVADFETKQKTATENEQKTNGFLTKVEEYKTSIEAIDKNTVVWEEEIKKAKEEIALRAEEYEALTSKLKNEKIQIEDAYVKIYGKTETDGKITKGYFQEIEDLKDSTNRIVTDFEIKQKTAIENEQKITDFLAKIETHKTAIETIDKNTTLWEGEIKKAKEDILSKSAEYEDLASKSKITKTEIETAHEKIYGRKEEDGKTTKGYIQEIDDLKAQITSFIAEQDKKFTAQFTHIESLLPGATSAGLAEAYQIQKSSYDDPIKNWSRVFIWTIVIMTTLSVVLLGLQIWQSTISTISDAFIALLKDLPFFIPTIWLAVFASKQQSQYKRLQQEYAFKETNAKSFHGHKKQIEELMKGESDKELLLQLVAQLVVITSQNPSDTLDNKAHNDSPPIFKLVEKILPSLKKNKEDAK